MKSLNIMIVVSTSPEIKDICKETCFMMKFIKMKYYDREAYLLLFVVIVVFVVFSELKSEKHSRIARVCTFLCPKFFTSAGET